MDKKQITENKIFLSWTTPEFAYHKKGLAWFIVLALIAIVFFIIALIMQNYIFALLVLLASFLIYIQALKKPPKIKVAIAEEGITVQETLFPYKELSSFWLFEEMEIRTLSLESKKLLRPRISIPLAQQNPNEIRQILIGFIPERKQEETLIDVIARKIRF
jgi:predicted membrane metal-binding protein